MTKRRAYGQAPQRVLRCAAQAHEFAHDLEASMHDRRRLAATQVIVAIECEKPDSRNFDCTMKCIATSFEMIEVVADLPTRAWPRSPSDFEQGLDRSLAIR